MNMNTANVHTPNKTLLSKSSHLFLAGLLMSSLLTACGGSSGPSAEELASQAAKAAAAAQAAADKVAADKAAADKAAALAAQAAAEHDAAVIAARKAVAEAVASVATEAKQQRHKLRVRSRVMWLCKRISKPPLMKKWRHRWRKLRLTPRQRIPKLPKRRLKKHWRKPQAHKPKAR
ncbi:MAG: hypothetical protein BWK73_50185 [Thiothrix lacustris]|uniref:Uncharacterized protein n=1 Tax=Thiothrix lacustris TaxID=525917 RepID=A0A1Y1Q8J4_9GAMM|nr:MAG: hypothetical protein BWK73_50185 [Thiothrix lacustris]